MIFIAILFQILWLIERNIKPMMMIVAKEEVKKIAQDAMLHGIRDVQNSLGNRLNDTWIIEKDQKGRISRIQVNNQIGAQIYDRLTSRIQEEINHLESKDIGISMGQMLQSNIFAEYGPHIPLQIWPKGAVTINWEYKYESQGINMVMVTLVLKVHADMEMLVPFTEESVMVDFPYPFAQTLVVGDVPNTYFNNNQGQIKEGKANNPIPTPSVPVVPAH
jgi:sporulation protein YunB